MKKNLANSKDFKYLDTFDENICSHKWILDIGDEKSSRNIEYLINLIDSLPQKNIIISEEDLVFKDSKIYSEIINRYNVKIIVYFRSPFLHDLSALNFQSQQSIFKKPIDVFELLEKDDGWLPRAYYTNEIFLNNWYSKINKEKFELVYYDDVVMNSNVISEFCKLINFRDNRQKYTARLNQTISFPAVFFVIQFMKINNFEKLPLDYIDKIQKLSTSSILMNYQYVPYKRTYLMYEDKDRVLTFNAIGKLLSIPNYFIYGRDKLIKEKSISYKKLINLYYQHKIEIDKLLLSDNN